VIDVSVYISSDGSADNPVNQSLNWFSYVAGDDIRAASVTVTPDDFRFFWNGV